MYLYLILYFYIKFLFLVSFMNYKIWNVNFVKTFDDIIPHRCFKFPHSYSEVPQYMHECTTLKILSEYHHTMRVVKNVLHTH